VRNAFLSPPAYRGSERRPSKAEAVRAVLEAALPPLRGDTLTHVEATVGAVGSPAAWRQWIATLGTCAPLPTAPDTTVVECASEAEVLAAFRDDARTRT
jgi:hypothetical protein